MASPEAEFDFAIVGSGFGGSVAALRLSQKGYRVVLLEQGRRWQAQEFPQSNWRMRRYLWKPRLRCFGIQRMDLLRHALVLGGVGVGGGSLVYGNTLYRPGKSFFEHPSIRALGGAAGLLPYYSLAEKMMGVTENRHLTSVDEALRATAAELGREETFAPSPIGVFTGEPGVEVPDPYFLGDGPPRSGCTHCGGCFIGCRVGAKNTLDRNYLHLAEQLGCVILPETRTLGLRPLGERGSEGWELDLESSTSLLSRRRRRLKVRRVVLSAGVLGTLGLLLRGQRSGELDGLSDRLGRGVRTNSETVVGVRCRGSVDHSRGVAASSSMWPDGNTQVQADRYPAGSDALTPLSTLMVDGGGRLPRPLRLVLAALRHPLDFLRTLWPFGFARQTVFLVTMQDHESSLRLIPKRRLLAGSEGLCSEVEGDSAPPSWIAAANQVARRLSRKLNGIPMSSTVEVVLGKPVTAHILGGCGVGGDASEGVIDRDHRVFGYENLWVCDGTVLPTNLGVNPALSILALAERAIARIPPRGGDPASFRPLEIDRAWGTRDLLLPRID